MVKKLTSIFGPVLLAAVLLMVFFFSPWKINSDDPKILAEAATSMAPNVLRGNVIKNNAIASDQYVPFFGSSELSRVSPTHPSVLAQKYHRGYTPFLLGAPGTQSLTQFSLVQSMAKELKGKKAVFVLSPQWFTPHGVNEDYFNNYYSEQQVFDWALHLKKIDGDDRYYAERLLQFKKVRDDDLTTTILTGIKNGDLPTSKQKDQLQLQFNMLSREDELFSGIGLSKNLQKRINEAAKLLPKQYDYQQIAEIVDKEAKKQTTNNDFGIKNSFFRKRLEKNLDALADSQRHWDYRDSPEYSDFQLVLNEFAKYNVDVLFVIPPINDRWTAFTGLPPEALSGFDEKIRYQLTSQGFKNIADFTKNGHIDFFMEDTIHLGWLGWLAADKAIDPFLADKQKNVSYSINPKFLTEEWQKFSPTGQSIDF